MTAHARNFARLCRERLIEQGMTEEQAAEACEEEQAAAERSTAEEDQVKPS
jgi:hypothetical protein